MGFGRYMDSCGVCMKYSLFFINLLTFLGGLAVVGLGTWMAIDKSFTAKMLGTNLYTGAIYILIGTGAIVALLSCFGCFGAAQEVKCMLVTYFIIVFLIFVTMLVGGILGYVFRNKVETSIEIGLKNSLQEYNTSATARKEWDDIQTGFRCCGITDYVDWNGYLPDSCCEAARPQIEHRCMQDDISRFQEGCLTHFVKTVKENAAIIGGVGIGVACVMLLEMIFTCALINMIE